ncbi:MAG: 4Fe-4S binding protein [Anaerolineae bacterium]|nr:4Fe-4S binding protein [Anaerolineae bacterium]
MTRTARPRLDRPPVIAPENCFGCYVCASSCPWEAVVVR